MVKATFDVLSETDKQLVLETEPKRLRLLSEDELIELHGRVRRARTKHRNNYRRASSAQVTVDRARGKASAKSRRDAARAEVFESALARVSRHLAVAAKASADELRRERLEVAGKAKAKPGQKAKAKSSKTAATKGAGPKVTKAPKASPATKKQRASTKAAGKQRQAKRDSRSKR